MIWIISTLTALICCYVISYLIVFTEIKKLSNNKFWPVLSLAIAVLVAYYTIPYVYDWLLTVFNLSSKYFLFGLIVLSGLIIGAVGGVSYLYYKLSKSQSKLAAFIFCLFACIISTAFFFHVLEIKARPMTFVWIISSIVAVVSLYFIIANWRNIQDYSAISITYILNLAMTTVFIWSVLGINIFRDITSLSAHTFAPFIIANVGLFVLMYIISPYIFWLNRFSRKLVYLWLFIIIGVTLLTTVLQMTGKMDKYEAMLARYKNQLIIAKHDLSSKNLSEKPFNGVTVDNAITVLEDYRNGKINNLEIISETLEGVSGHLKAQRKNIREKEKFEWPQGYVDTYAYAGNLGGKFLGLFEGKPEGVEFNDVESIKWKRLSERSWTVEFQTDDPVRVLNRWPAGRVIVFSGPTDEVFMNDPKGGSGLDYLPMGYPLRRGIDKPLIIKYKKGGKINMLFS